MAVMTTEIEIKNSRLDFLKWSLVLLLVAVGVYGFYYLEQQPLYLRIIGELLVASVAILVALQTNKGRSAWRFIGESRHEVRKVVWPTRQETVRATLVVVVVVLIATLFLWVLDATLAKLAAWFIG